MSGFAETFWLSLSATLQAASLASTGIYFHRAGFVETPQVLARYFQQIGLPCLFFAKIVFSRIKTNQEDDFGDDNFIRSALLFVWPIYVVMCGLFIGHILAFCAGLPAEQRKVLLVATSIGNSTSLPLILLTAMAASNEKMGAAADRVLSSFFVLYPLLQWGMGGTLLGLGELSPQKSNKRHKRNFTLTRSSSSSTISSSSRNDEVVLDERIQMDIERPDCIVATVIDAEEASTNSKRRLKTGIDNQLNCFRASVQRAVRQPPVVGAFLASFVTLVPFLQASLVEGSLKWLGQAIITIGNAAVPVSMAVLGVNLSIAFSSNCKIEEYINHDLVIAGATGKLLFMPLIGLSTIRVLHFYLDLDPGTAMAMSLLFCTPTASAVMVMTDLSPVLDKKTQMGMARMLALQYLVAPVFLPLWVMRTIRIAHGG